MLAPGSDKITARFATAVMFGILSLIADRIASK
jgi:hypothetical protein